MIFCIAHNIRSNDLIKSEWSFDVFSLESLALSPYMLAYS